jgi:hypothetical protein
VAPLALALTPGALTRTLTLALTLTLTGCAAPYHMADGPSTSRIRNRALLLSLGIMACAGEKNRTAALDTSPASPATAPAAADSACPATGRWAPCSLVKRLERAGLAPQALPDTVRDPALSVPGSAFTLGNAELRVFLYPDRAAQDRDAAKLDRTRFVSADAPITLRGEATLIRSQNLLAILTSRSDAQRERVADALEAGPPVP